MAKAAAQSPPSLTDHHDRFRLREHGAFMRACNHVAVAAHDSRLSAPARALAQVLCDCWALKNSQALHYCYPSLTALEQRTGYSRPTVIAARIELRSGAYIFFTHGHATATRADRKACRYYPRLSPEARARKPAVAKLPAPINLSTIKPRDIDAHEVRTREDWAARWLSFDPELFTDFPEVLVFTLDQMKVFDVEWKRQDEACERGEIEAINTPQIVDDVRDVLG